MVKGGLFLSCFYAISLFGYNSLDANCIILAWHFVFLSNQVPIRMKPQPHSEGRGRGGLLPPSGDWQAKDFSQRQVNCRYLTHPELHTTNHEWMDYCSASGRTNEWLLPRLLWPPLCPACSNTSNPTCFALHRMIILIGECWFFLNQNGYGYLNCLLGFPPETGPAACQTETRIADRAWG